MAQCCLPILHRLRDCRRRDGDLVGGGVSAISGRIRPHQPRPSDCRLSALAGDVRADDSRAVRALSLWASRRLAKWRWISIGSVFAALAWLAVSSLFSWYLGN